MPDIGRALAVLVCACRWVHAVVTQEQRERVTKHIFAASFLSKHQMPPAKYLPGYDPSQDPANAVQHSDWTRRSYRRNTSHKNVEFFQRKMMKQRKRRRRRKKDWEDESESDGENFALSARLTKKLSSVRDLLPHFARACCVACLTLHSPLWCGAATGHCPPIVSQHDQEEVHLRHRVGG